MRERAPNDTSADGSAASPTRSEHETRIPPLALGSEDAVVGCLVVSPGASLDALRNREFDPADMMQPFCRNAVTTALEIGSPLDLALVAQRMNRPDALAGPHGRVLDAAWSLYVLDRPIIDRHRPTPSRDPTSRRAGRRCLRPRRPPRSDLRTAIFGLRRFCTPPTP